MEYILVIIIILLIMYIIKMHFEQKKREAAEKKEKLKRQTMVYCKSLFTLFFKDVKSEYSFINFNFSYYHSNEYIECLFEKLFSEKHYSKYTSYGREILQFVLNDLEKDILKNKDVIYPSEELTDSYREKYADIEYEKQETEYNYVKTGSIPPDWEYRKRIIWYRDQGKCMRCGCKPRYRDAEIYHILNIPGSSSNSLCNIVTICHDCHIRMKAIEELEQYQTYYLSRNSYKFHSEICRYATNSIPIKEKGINILNRGYEPCAICNPCGENAMALYKYKYSYREVLENMYRDFWHIHSLFVLDFQRKVSRL